MRRYQAVTRVLLQILVLNVVVAAAKLMYGYYSGSVSILSDGFHSLTDSCSNVAALIGVRVARKPPDDDHPYGHRKFETMAAGAIAAFLLLVIVEIGRGTLRRLRRGGAPDIGPEAFGLMIVTLSINLFVTWYERRQGERLGSEVLFADAMHTRSDVLTSMAVIAALVGTELGYPLLDPLAALVIVGFIAYAGWQIAMSTSGILADRVVIAETDLRDLVMSVPDVIGCHRIRTRGAADHVFLDLHLWMRSDMRLDAAHAKSHEVKDLLMTRFPQIADAIIHLEPPPKGWAETDADAEKLKIESGK